MKRTFRSHVLAIIGVTLFYCISIRTILAQENINVKEPPVPVYIISPYHEDSLTATGGGVAQANSLANATLLKKLDTLQQQAHKSSAETTAHFIWLYTLIALLGIMNIVLLFSSSHVRKELVQMRHFEHQKMLLAAEASSISQRPPKILEVPAKPEPLLSQAPTRPRKPRTSKPRVKKEK
jgi:hypothetical protein